MAWFLNDLPSFNKDNFSKLRVDDPAKPVVSGFTSGLIQEVVGMNSDDLARSK